jgi:hypothetical protein
MSQDALCALHTDRPAVGTCVRCGRFVCAACAGEDRACPECSARDLLSLPDGSGRAMLAAGLLWANVAGDSLAILASGLGLALSAGSANTALDILDGLIGLVRLAALVGGAVTYLRWLHLAVRSTNAVGLQVGATPGWACGYFFVPIANLYRPFRILRDMALGLGGRAVSAPVSAWWGCWIASNVLSQIDFRLSSTEGATTSSIYLLRLVADALSIAAAIQCIRVVRAIQSELSARRQQATPAAA